MAVLSALLVTLMLVSPSVFASGEDPDIDPRAIAIKEQAKQLCGSTDEYIKTLRFLQKSKDIVFNENTARKIAEKVSRGCDGASERFTQILILLKTVGLSDPKALA